MTDTSLSDLIRAVQYNCNISDARHGTDFSLCIYLMKMREYYRWEKRLPFDAALERGPVGDWLQAREALWEQLEEADMRPIELDGQVYDPFDADGINACLRPAGLVYSSGLGNNAKPHFVLGDLQSHREAGAYSIYVVAEEYARDLAAPPAMTLGRNIFLRRESLRRMLWEKLESWRWNRPDNALGRAFACYDFEDALDASLDAMVEREIDVVLLHEQGEHEAGERLGDDWNPMLMDLTQTPAELMARAVRDHLADCLVTLPEFARRGDDASIHFYIGNLTHLRKDLFPGLEHAYDAWRQSRDVAPIQDIAERGRQHWERLGMSMMELHARSGPDAADAIRELTEANRL